ncbi:MAG: hypothetical protein ACD_75C00331G0003 [uncultured bacterium]|nr:MAG: hypothetical protein ACD_75C00331G0003 [uncultured bacterium]
MTTNTEKQNDGRPAMKTGEAAENAAVKEHIHAQSLDYSHFNQIIRVNCMI